jgi:hypothetical protein
MEKKMEKKIKNLYIFTIIGNYEYYVVAENLGCAEKILLQLLGNDISHVKSATLIASECHISNFKELIIQE